MKTKVALLVLCVAGLVFGQEPIPPASPYPLPAVGSFCLTNGFGPVRPKINDDANAWVDVNVCGAISGDGQRFAVDRWDVNRWVRQDVSPVLGGGYHYGTFLDVVISRTEFQIFRVLVIDANGGVVGTPTQWDTGIFAGQLIGIPVLP